MSGRGVGSRPLVTRMVFEARGASGELRVGHRVAATLGTWSLVRKADRLADDRATVATIILTRDAFWWTQHPQDLWLGMGRAWWVWRGAVVTGETGVSIVVRGDPDIVEGL